MTSKIDPLANAFTAAELMKMHFPDLCPSCGKEAHYAASPDRYFHTDGSSNRDCWIRLLGEEINR